MLPDTPETQKKEQSWFLKEQKTERIEFGGAEKAPLLFVGIYILFSQNTTVFQ